MVMVCQESFMFPEEQFGLSEEFCSNIEDYRNTTAYDRVESEVRRGVGRVGAAQCADGQLQQHPLLDRAPRPHPHLLLHRQLERPLRLGHVILLLLIVKA